MNHKLRIKGKILILLVFLVFVFLPKISWAIESICPGGSNPDPNVVFCEDFEIWTYNPSNGTFSGAMGIPWGVGAHSFGTENLWGDFVKADKAIYGNAGAWSGQLLFDGAWGTWGYQSEICWPGDELSEMYIRFYFYLSPTYVFGTSLGEKLFLLNDCARTIGPYLAIDAGHDPHTVMFINYQDKDWDENPVHELINRYPNIQNVSILAGHTYRVEWYIKQDDPGASNGLVKLWVDDVTNGDAGAKTLTMDLSDIRYLKVADAGKKYGRIRLTDYSQVKCISPADPNECYSIGGGHLAESIDKYMAWDNIVVSKASIGPVSGSVFDTTPPAAPSGVTVI